MLWFEWFPFANLLTRPSRSYDIKDPLTNRLLGLQFSEVLIADMCDLVLRDPKHIG